MALGSTSPPRSRVQTVDVLRGLALLGIVVVLRTADAGPEATIDIPQQGATGLPLVNVTLTSERGHFELPAGPSVATFDGAQRDGTLSGTTSRATGMRSMGVGSSLK